MTVPIAQQSKLLRGIKHQCIDKNGDTYFLVSKEHLGPADDASQLRVVLNQIDLGEGQSMLFIGSTLLIEDKRVYEKLKYKLKKSDDSNKISWTGYYLFLITDIRMRVARKPA